MSATDTALLQQWRAGNTAAGEALFERYYDAVERFFLNKVSIGVEDLVQATFLACVEGRERVHDNSRFRAYVFSVAYNVLCGYLRKKYREGQVLDCNEVSICDVAPGPGSLMVHHREQLILLQALRSIPVDFQVLLELHYWESMKTAEMAEVLGMPVGTVRGRLRRARELLEQAMSELAQNEAELHNTVSQLDDWARACRGQMDARNREQ